MGWGPLKDFLLRRTPDQEQWAGILFPPLTDLMDAPVHRKISLPVGWGFVPNAFLYRCFFS